MTNLDQLPECKHSKETCRFYYFVERRPFFFPFAMALLVFTINFTNFLSRIALSSFDPAFGIDWWTERIYKKKFLSKKEKKVVKAKVAELSKRKKLLRRLVLSAAKKREGATEKAFISSRHFHFYFQEG